MIKNIPAEDLKDFLSLQERLGALIGKSDDAGIEELQNFIQSRNGKITLTASDLETLAKLKPQKIASARYLTPTI